MNVDELVKSWIKHKFFESGEYERNVHGDWGNVFVLSADGDWDCGCYSSWTRDDSFKVTAKMVGKGGRFDFSYGTHGDFPSFIEELDAYRNNVTCSFENRSY